MTVNGECGCAAKARAMRIGGVPIVVAPAVEGLATLSAMDHAHTISSWAARRLPAARGTFGDASGGNARGTVSQGGRYHPAGARVGQGESPGATSQIGRLSGVAMAHRAIAALPDDMIAAQILRAWLKHNPSRTEREAAAAELVRLGYPHAADIVDPPELVSDAGEPERAPRSQSSWARSRGASIGQAPARPAAPRDAPHCSLGAGELLALVIDHRRDHPPARMTPGQAARQTIGEILAWVDCAGRTDRDVSELAGLLEHRSLSHIADGVRAQWSDHFDTQSVDTTIGSAWSRRRARGTSRAARVGQVLACDPIAAHRATYLAHLGRSPDRAPSSWARSRTRSRGAVVGGVVQDRIMQLSASWDTLKTDIFASPLTDATFRAGFMRDATVWQGFAATHIDDWINLHTTIDQVESYRQTLEHWRAAFVALGGHSTGTETAPPPAGLIERAQEAAEAPSRTIESVTSSIAIGVTAIAIAWAVTSIRR